MPMSRLPRPQFKWSENLSHKNKQFTKDIALKRKETSNLVAEKKTSLLLNDMHWPVYEYKPGSRRTGMIMRKLGVQPLWLRDGKRVITTLFQGKVESTPHINYIFSASLVLT